MFIPIAFVITILILSILLIGFMVKYAKFRKAQSMDLKRYHVLSKRYNLSAKEESSLLNWAMAANGGNISRVLTNPERFEKAVRPIELHGRSAAQRMASSMREKLFDRKVRSDQSVRSTHDLAIGIKLFITYQDYQDTSLWGHLIDSDDNGLIVVIPSYHEVRIPLRPETRLDVTAFMPKREPIEFHTWVKSVIPGPRKMVILEHASFVVPKASAFASSRLAALKAHKKPNGKTSETPEKKPVETPRTEAPDLPPPDFEEHKGKAPTVCV